MAACSTHRNQRERERSEEGTHGFEVVGGFGDGAAEETELVQRYCFLCARGRAGSARSETLGAAREVNTHSQSPQESETNLSPVHPPTTHQSAPLLPSLPHTEDSELETHLLQTPPCLRQSFLRPLPPLSFSSGESGSSPTQPHALARKTHPRLPERLVPFFQVFRGREGRENCCCLSPSPPSAPARERGERWTYLSEM